MGVVMQVILQLVQFHLIGFALAVQGSEGSILPSPLASPPLLSSPSSTNQLENGPSSISHPNGSTLSPPLAPPPQSTLPPPNVMDLAPSWPPSMLNLSAPPPETNGQGVAVPLASDSPELAPSRATPASLAPAPSVTLTRNAPSNSPVRNASAPGNFPPTGDNRNESQHSSPAPGKVSSNPAAPPSGDVVQNTSFQSHASAEPPMMTVPPPEAHGQGVGIPLPSDSPEIAPSRATPVSLAPAPSLTQSRNVPSNSPVRNASTPGNFPPAGDNRNESRRSSPAPKKVSSAPAPAASPSSDVVQNAPSVQPLAPAEPPSITDHGVPPASPPLKKQDMMPPSPPPDDMHTQLPPVKHPPKGSTVVMAPSSQRASAPAPSLFPFPRGGHRPSASSPSVSFGKDHHATKPLPPPSHSPLPSKGPFGAVAPSPHTTHHNSDDALTPSPSIPSSGDHNYSASSPLPSFNKHQHVRNKIIGLGPASPHPISSPTPSRQDPLSPPDTLSRSKQTRRDPLSPSPGSSISPSHSTSPASISDAPPVPSPSPKTAYGNHKMPHSKSSSSNLVLTPPPPIRALPPPPPNEDCLSTSCTEPYTNTPPGSPCGCVLPMQVGLRLDVALYTFFPLVSELAEEIALGVFMKQSQVRIMGANAASQQPEKTVVLIDLVPLGNKFDNTTAFLTFERFWHKEVFINASFFGDYEVLYVQYPGLPASPPLPPDATMVDGGPYSANDNNARTNKPLGVDIQKGQHNNHGLSGGVMAVIVLSAFVAVLLCLAAAWVWVLRRGDKVFRPAPTPPALLPSVAKSSGIAGSALGSALSSASLSFGSSIATYAGSAKTFSASEIEKATDCFSDSRILGEGGFGRVYSGVLEDGTNVAVKVLKREDQQGGREFLAEVEMLSRLHHRNLVKLIGICTEERARCLVYELIPNGSVESHLHGVDKENAPLDWCARMKIALGAARGLAYLHEDSSPRVIHRDFKASNILLEQDFTPKVSDFGLARTALDEDNKHISTRVMGTFGYVAPEYAMTGHLLVKSDVYSYGVVLLELLTGRKPVDMSQPPGQENLVAWARPLLTCREGLEAILDPSLGPDVPIDSVAKVAAIASMCVQPEVSHRPFMGEVVQALKLVCDECECDGAREARSRSSSREDLSIDLEPEISACSGQLQGPLHGRDSDPEYDPVSYSERGLSVSDFIGTSSGPVEPVSGSFRRYSSSDPSRTGRGRRFWQRMRRSSGGSGSEHGPFFGLWPGSQ